MPRTKASDQSSAASASTRARKRRQTTSTPVEQTQSNLATPEQASPVAMPQQQDEGSPIATGLVESGKQSALNQTSPAPEMPDVAGYMPADMLEDSSALPPMTDEQSKEAIKSVSEKINRAKLMQKNATLAGELANQRMLQAKAIKTGVQAAKEIEGVSTAVSQYDQQVTSTQLSREKQYQATMELAGLEAARALVERQITAKRQLKLNQIQRVETQAARVLSGTVDNGPIDVPSETVDY